MTTHQRKLWNNPRITNPNLIALRRTVRVAQRKLWFARLGVWMDRMLWAFVIVWASCLLVMLVAIIISYKI